MEGTILMSSSFMLKKHVYRNRGRHFGYGLKFLTRLESLKEKMPHLKAAFEKW